MTQLTIILGSKNLRRDELLWLCLTGSSVESTKCAFWMRLERHRSLRLCGQSLATNALKHLMDQLEERILQTDQLKTLQSVCSIALTPAFSELFHLIDLYFRI